MQPGRVYRRQDLGGVSTAIDRDLGELVRSGQVRKLTWGLYCLAGPRAPDDKEVVRAFLKTDDFLLCPDAVYNRKRSGEFRLGGRRFRFRVVRTYPKGPGGASIVRDSGAVRIVPRTEEPSDFEYWQAKPPAERVAAVEFLREQHYALAGYKSLPRLAHTIQLLPRTA